MKKVNLFLFFYFILFISFAFSVNDLNKTYKTSVPFGDIKPRTLMYTAEVTDRLVYDAEEEIEVYLNSEIESEYTLDLSTNKNQFYEIDVNFADYSTNVYTLIIPPCESLKSGKLNLYLHQSPVNSFQYDISDENISLSNFPKDKVWLTDKDDAIWKFEFRSLPGTTDWILVRYSKHVVEPFDPEYSRFWFDDGSIIGKKLTTITNSMFYANLSLTNVELSIW